uniref:DUF438 domain-containing protein n=1 Tax=candidate division WOR-3 bacterium TaxID=2052148 RepID=A0A7V0Z442_UNCW3
MDKVINKEEKKRFIRELILKLHMGFSVEEAKNILLKEIGTITSTEIAEIEQSLINEGTSPDEIKRFCNVHALLFESALKQEIKPESSSHPVSLFKLENRAIEKILEQLKTAKEKGQIEELLKNLKEIEIHYTRKEQLLFPYLEKKGFFGPSKVMWGKDNEVRELLRNALEKIAITPMKDYTSTYLNPLIEEIEGMILKEENILFPTAMEKLDPEDWIEILKESVNVGYAYIEPPQNLEALIKDLRQSLIEQAAFTDGEIKFPSGGLNLEELLAILNNLPIDLTFVDKDDRVKYFSETKERIFLRPRAVIGRDVRNCHPPQSLDKVEKIINDFKEGKRDVASFWINFKGKLIYIRYFAIRDSLGRYLGTLEVTQDITKIKKLEGERRLLDEGD